jgi:hypothetical protein
MNHEMREREKRKEVDVRECIRIQSQMLPKARGRKIGQRVRVDPCNVNGTIRTRVWRCGGGQKVNNASRQHKKEENAKNRYKV